MFDHPGVWNKIVKFIILLNHYCSCGTMFVASMGKPFPTNLHPHKRIYEHLFNIYQNCYEQNYGPTNQGKFFEN